MNGEGQHFSATAAMPLGDQPGSNVSAQEAGLHPALPPPAPVALRDTVRCLVNQVRNSRNLLSESLNSWGRAPVTDVSPVDAACASNLDQELSELRALVTECESLSALIRRVSLTAR